MAVPALTIATLDEVVTAYHGTSYTIAASILSSREFCFNRNIYDPLGHGVYFWQDDEQRAWRWAQEHHPAEPAVLRVRVRLGVCLDFLTARFYPLLRQFEAEVRAEYDRGGRALPRQHGFYRPVDCEVMNRICAMVTPPIETVRGRFSEGKELYDGSIYRDDDHVQLCVRARENITLPAELL